MSSSNDHQDDLFNGIGECEFKNQSYLLKLSINAHEVIHFAKFFTSSEDEVFKQKITSFLSFIEGRKIHDVVSFFEQSSDASSTQEMDPLLYCWHLAIFDYTGELPLLKNKMKNDDVICSCAGLSWNDIQKLKSSSHFTMESLVKETKAGTGCGACRADLKKIMETFQEFPHLTVNSYLRLWASLEISSGEFLCRCKKVTLREIAEVFETYQNQSHKVYGKLQSQYGIGISCTACSSSIMSFLKN